MKYPELDKAIIRCYPKFDHPSDLIVKNDGLLEGFKEFMGKVADPFDLEFIAGRLLNLRKANKLPKIRDGHGPPKGKKQGAK